MQGKITSDLSFCLAEEGFSLDELVIKLSDMLERKAMPELLRLILQLVQEVFMSRLSRGGALPFACCEGGGFVLNGAVNRGLRTSVGVVAMDFWRVKCRCCGKTFSLLGRILKLKRYQTKSNELEKLVVDAVAATSYRRAVAELHSHGKVLLPHRTAHNWVMLSDCDEIKVSPKVFGAMPSELLSDGTKFKGQGEGGKARQGDLKVAIGVNTQGEVFPLGTWAGVGWEDVGKDLKTREVKLPDGSILISDGEQGLAENLAGFVEDHQRCHWHITRDLYHAMWQDGGTSREAKPLQSALAGVLAIELPSEDFKKVTESEKDAVEERMELAEGQVGKLIAYLEGAGYHTAANYLTRAKHGMFAYVRRWLKWGLICPRASSLVERVMRELARRIKRIAYGWSDRGVEKIAKIILKKFTSQKEWEDYWQKRMNIIGNVVVSIGNYKASSHDLAH